jgi:rubrerythrin
MDEKAEAEKSRREQSKLEKGEKIYVCDRCGHEMVEKNCKLICPNCGNRFDCSDLNLYFD